VRQNAYANDIADSVMGELNAWANGMGGPGNRLTRTQMENGERIPHLSHEQANRLASKLFAERTTAKSWIEGDNNVWSLAQKHLGLTTVKQAKREPEKLPTGVSIFAAHARKYPRRG
jgi:hypothetical protein